MSRSTQKMRFSYRFSLRSKHWYMYHFWHTVKIAAVNMWFIYKRHVYQRGHRSMPLREFLAELATAIVLFRKRPPGRPSIELPPPAKKQSTMATPRDVRFDTKEHWPIWNTRRNRCKACAGDYTFKVVRSAKKVCINKDTNCFVAFHRQ